MEYQSFLDSGFHLLALLSFHWISCGIFVTYLSTYICLHSFIFIFYLSSDIYFNLFQVLNSVMNTNWINWRKIHSVMSWKIKATDDVVPSDGLRWKSTMHPVLASALIGLCSPVETRTVSASDWWDASYAWPWLCFRHTVKHSIPAPDLVWLIWPPVFLCHLLF